jgi:hypothetical protein
VDPKVRDVARSSNLVAKTAAKIVVSDTFTADLFLAPIKVDLTTAKPVVSENTIRRTSRAMLLGLAARSVFLPDRPKVTRLLVSNSTIKFRTLRDPILDFAFTSGPRIPKSGPFKSVEEYSCGRKPRHS